MTNNQRMNYWYKKTLALRKEVAELRAMTQWLHDAGWSAYHDQPCCPRCHTLWEYYYPKDYDTNMDAESVLVQTHTEDCELARLLAS